jgi:hypothetical protein
VIAHALDAEIIESGVHQRPMTPAPGLLNLILFQLFVKDLLPVRPVKVDRCVVDGETLHELDGLQVIHTPGHSAGQIAFFSSQAGGPPVCWRRGRKHLGTASVNLLRRPATWQADASQAGKAAIHDSLLCTRENAL